MAVESFEGNIVLVVKDTGTGNGGRRLMNRGKPWCEEDSPLDSATFGQAVAKCLTVRKAEEEQKKKKEKPFFKTSDLRKLDAVQKQQLTLS